MPRHATTHDKDRSTSKKSKHPNLARAAVAASREEETTSAPFLVHSHPGAPFPHAHTHALALARAQQQQMQQQQQQQQRSQAYQAQQAQHLTTQTHAPRPLSASSSFQLPPGDYSATFRTAAQNYWRATATSAAAPPGMSGTTTTATTAVAPVAATSVEMHPLAQLRHHSVHDAEALRKATEPQNVITQRPYPPPEDAHDDSGFLFWVDFNPAAAPASSGSSHVHSIFDADVYLLTPGGAYSKYAGSFRSLLTDTIIHTDSFVTGPTPDAYTHTHRRDQPIWVDDRLNVLVRSLCGGYYLDQSVEPQPVYPSPHVSTALYDPVRHLRFQWCQGLWFIAGDDASSLSCGTHAHGSSVRTPSALTTSVSAAPKIVMPTVVRSETGFPMAPPPVRTRAQTAAAHPLPAPPVPPARFASTLSAGKPSFPTAGYARNGQNARPTNMAAAPFRGRTGGPGALFAPSKSVVRPMALRPGNMPSRFY